MDDWKADALLQFRSALSDVLRSADRPDHYLLRWLKARNFDLKKAELMFRQSLAWREEWDVDNILEKWEPPEVLKRYWPGGHCGYDIEGHPVWLNNLGYIDLQGMLQSAKKDDIIRYNIRRMEICEELCRQQTRKLGRPIVGVVQVSDVAGFGISSMFVPGVDTFKDIMTLFEANYPEQLKISYIINAPRVFPVMFSFIRPFVREETRKKLFVLGSAWKNQLIERISEENLPENWGGSRRQPDEFCSDLICVGGEIPKSFYLRDSLIISREKLVNIYVLCGDVWPIEIIVSEPGTLIRWVFETKNHDIAFGLFRKTNSKQKSFNKMKEIIKMNRFRSHIIPEDGTHSCDEAGTYVAVFDNSYSWVHSKEVGYLLETHEPDRLVQPPVECLEE